MQDDWGLDTGTAAGNDQWRTDGLTASGSGQERFHLALFICALAGGILASLIGRAIYDGMYDPSGSNIVMVGLILAVISGLVLLACVLCELFRPRLTVNRELNLPRILSGLLVAVVVFAVGCLCEFIYEWGSASTRVTFDDYIFAIDDSESMLETDPMQLRYSALGELLDSLDDDQRAGLVRFNENARASVDMAELDEAQRALLSEELDNPNSAGTTNIFGALEVSLDMYRDAARSNRVPVVVLLSDGFHSSPYGRNDFNRAVDAFLKEDVVINTVSLGQNADEVLLEQLAQATGGQYFKVEEAGDLAEGFHRASTAVTYRCLFSPRSGVQRWDVLYMILRVLFLALPGIVIGFFILLLLQHRLAYRQLLVSGVAGLLAGVTMEMGTLFFLPLLLTHAISWILYSIVLVCYSDSVSGIRQSEFEMDLSEGLDSSSLSADTRDVSRVKEGKFGKIDRTDDWGRF